MRDILVLSGLQPNLQSSLKADDFIDKCISSFEKDESIFYRFLYWCIYIKILFKKNKNIQTINKLDFIKELLPKKIRKSVLKEFQMNSDLIFPRPVMSTSSFILFCVLLLVPVLLILYVVFLHPETLPVFFELVFLGGGLIIVFPLVIVIHFLKPELLVSNDLPRVKNYNDFIKEVLKINEHFFVINKYQRTKNELMNLYLTKTNCIRNN